MDQLKMSSLKSCQHSVCQKYNKPSVHQIFYHPATMCKVAALLPMILIFTLAKHASSFPTALSDQCVDISGNYSQNEMYAHNLKSVLSDLINHASNSSFYNSTAGKAGMDKVYALFYCRGDTGSEDCHDCVQAAALQARASCPSQKEVVAWYLQCTLRYANRSIFSLEEQNPRFVGVSHVNVSNPNLLEQIVSTTMHSLINQAAYNSTPGGFATGVANYSSSNIYFLVQCTPDMLGIPCQKCLLGALNFVRTSGSKAAYIMLPSCLIMYDFDYFFSNSSSLAPPSPPPPKGKESFVFSSIVALPTSAVVSLLCGMSIGYLLDFNKLSSWC